MSAASKLTLTPHVMIPRGPRGSHTKLATSPRGTSKWPSNEEDKPSNWRKPSRDDPFTARVSDSVQELATLSIVHSTCKKRGTGHLKRSSQGPPVYAGTAAYRSQAKGRVFTVLTRAYRSCDVHRARIWATPVDQNAWHNCVRKLPPRDTPTSVYIPPPKRRCTSYRSKAKLYVWSNPPQHSGLACLSRYTQRSLREALNLYPLVIFSTFEYQCYCFTLRTPGRRSVVAGYSNST